MWQPLMKFQFYWKQGCQIDEDKSVRALAAIGSLINTCTVSVTKGPLNESANMNTNAFLLIPENTSTV